MSESAGGAVVAFLDAVLAWLRVPVTGTLSRAELVFSPFIVAAFLFHSRNSVVMFRLWWRLRRADQDAELRDSARERHWRAMRGMLRLACWLVIGWVLAVNWPYTQVVFTLGALAYAVIEAVDAALDWVYQYQRARYWERRDAMEDYAQQVAARAEAAAARAEQVADDAAAAAVRIQADLEEALGELRRNTALTADGARHAAAAERKADAAFAIGNTINEKIVSLGDELTAQGRQEQLARDIPPHTAQDGGTG